MRRLVVGDHEAARATVTRVAALVLLTTVTIWGLRLTILEGFVYEWPRGFLGDFHAAMYEPHWWDGSGIMYGPVFVAERWLVNLWPQVFTVYWFALANIPAVVLAFGLSCRAARAPRFVVLVALAAWLCFRPLFYSFSVSANPEILEVLLLSFAWYAASRGKQGVAWVAWVLAALTKVIPVVFAPLLVFRASRHALLAGAVSGLLLIGIVGIGQRLSPKELLLAIAIPSQNVKGLTMRQAAHIYPIPSSIQATGLSSAMARTLALTDTDPALARVQRLSNALSVLLYLGSVLVVVRLLKGRHTVPEDTRLALAYGLFFALMPIVTLHAHPHTFVFLLPAVTAIIATLAADCDRRRSAWFAGLFFAVYVFAGFPTIVAPVDRLLGTHLASSTPFADPIWATLALVGLISTYALVRIHSATVEEFESEALKLPSEHGH